MHMENLQISYRKAKEDDVNFLMQLRQNTMTPHLLSSGIEVNPESYMQRILYNYNDARIILLNQKPIGLLKVTHHSDAVEIIQIQIDNLHQGQGIGTSIMCQIIENARIKNQAVTLSVLKTNKAINLYKKLGFTIISEEEHSYLMKAY